jgi:ribosomal protein L11 methyltransferase
MHELVLLASQAQAEPVADALIELGARSVAVEDADADTLHERALFGEPGMPAATAGWQRSILRALFDDEDAATAAAALLLAQDGSQGVQVQAMAPLAEQDWVRLTQSQFEPVAVTEGFWIVPTWHQPPADARTLIRLDPGLAFGTGTHPTTRMCLRWIATHAPRHAAGWNRVLDYGCGSGILAIGAALHGARHVDAVDIDPVAVTATLANAQANAVPEQASLRAGPPELAQGCYGLVLANILAAPLKLLAPLLAAHVGDEGHLVLAGILERQADELTAAYAPWLSLQVHDRLDGWVLMVARRASSSSFL